MSKGGGCNFGLCCQGRGGGTAEEMLQVNQNNYYLDKPLRFISLTTGAQSKARHIPDKEWVFVNKISRCASVHLQVNNILKKFVRTTGTVNWLFMHMYSVLYACYRPI